MATLNYDDGLILLKSAFTRTQGVLSRSTDFLFVVHAYYMGWLEDYNHWPGDDDHIRISFIPDHPLGNLKKFVESDRFEDVSFLRKSINRICLAFLYRQKEFEEIYSLLRSIPPQWFDDFWEKAFSDLLNTIFLSLEKESAGFSQPNEISDLVTMLYAFLFPHTEAFDHSIYDPFAGLGGFISCGHDNNYAQEIDEDTYALCRLRTLVCGFSPSASRNFTCGDSLSNWEANSDGVHSFDLISSFPPLGRRVQIRPGMNIEWPDPRIRIEDYFIYKGLRSLNPSGYLIGVFSTSVLFASGATAAQRKKLIREGRVKMVIQLPPNLLYHTTTPLCILVLSGEGVFNESILFFDASSFFTKDRRRNILNYADIFLALTGVKSELSRYMLNISIKDVEMKGSSLLPSTYFTDYADSLNKIPQGFELIPLESIVDVLGINIYDIFEERHVRVIRGKDLSAKGPIEFHTFSSLPQETHTGRILNCDALIIQNSRYLKPTLFRYTNETSIVHAKNLTALSIHDDIDPYYLVSELRKPYFTEQLRKLQYSLPKQLFLSGILSLKVLLPIERKLQHATYLSDLRSGEEAQLRTNEAEMLVKNERERLKEMMSIRRHRINPYISGLQNNVSMLLDELYFGGNLNIDSTISPDYTVRDALENMKESLCELKLLFDALTVDASVGVAESLDLISFLKRYSYTHKMPDRSFELDKASLSAIKGFPHIVFNKSNLTEVLDEIIYNAEKHFSPLVSNSRVMFVPRLDDNSVRLLICNNGEPVPPDFDEERSFAAGYHKDEKGTGTGLFRVRQVCDEFGAKVEWENDPKSLMQTGLCITFKRNEN